MVMIHVQAAEGRRLLGSLQFAATELVFPAGSGLQRQAAVSPQLPFGPETMRCLHEADQQGHPDWTEDGNLAQKLMSRMLLTFRQQLGTHHGGFCSMHPVADTVARHGDARPFRRAFPAMHSDGAVSRP